MPEPLTTQLVAAELERLRTAFPNRTSDKNAVQQAQIYRDALGGVSGDALRAAVRLIIQNDDYFPKVARLREVASEWQRKASFTEARNRPEGDSNICPLCGALAQRETIHRVVRDVANKSAPILDEYGHQMWEDVPSVQLHMRHDWRAHHGTSPRGGEIE